MAAADSMDQLRHRVVPVVRQVDVVQAAESIRRVDPEVRYLTRPEQYGNEPPAVQRHQAQLLDGQAKLFVHVTAIALRVSWREACEEEMAFADRLLDGKPPAFTRRDMRPV